MTKISKKTALSINTVTYFSIIIAYTKAIVKNEPNGDKHMNTKFYICKHCGNIITFAKASGVPISCCGEAMTELIANTTEAATEKHIPVVKRDGNKVTVHIGEIDHPMTPEHFIEWIALDTEDTLILKKRTPTDPPQGEFLVEKDKEITAYAYCNIHSLWK